MKITVWLQRHGYNDEGERQFLVVKAQNTLSPGINDLLSEIQVKNLISVDKMTVNIS